MRRILVTGASGFLGSRVEQYLRDTCGYEVFAPSHAEMDITDIYACRRIILSFKPDVIVHCAAISSTSYCQEHPEQSMLVNIEGTCNVVRAAKMIGAKTIYMSSDQVYQGANNQWTQTFKEEDTDSESYLPRSIYGQHKLSMERRGQAIDPSAIGLRLTWMYDEEHGIMANLNKLKATHSAIKACTHERRGVTDVWDVVKGIAKIIHIGDITGGIYNLGNESNCSTYELYLQLAKKMNIDTRLIIPDDTWSRSLAMDTSKSRNICN